MYDVGSFALLTTTIALITVATIATGSARRSERVARALYLFALIVGSAVVAITTARALGVAVPNPLFGIPFRALVFRGWLVVGAAVGALALLALRRVRPPTPVGTMDAGRASSDAIAAFVTSPHLRRALCVSVALAFLAVEIGKLAHDDEMRQFFLQSGYAVWFLYAVIALELLGAAGLLVPALTRPAAIGLSLMMLGAIGTHARNGDPFSDSLEAVHLLIILAGILAIAPATRRTAS